MSFLAHEENGLLIKTSTVLSGVRHGFSTRTGGVSPAPWDSLNLGVGRGDDMDRVRENYRRLCAVLGTDEHRAVLSKQVHEDNVRHVTAEDCGKGLFRERDYTSVDAMITDTPDIPLVVFSADCGIILLYDPVRRAVGAATPAGGAPPPASYIRPSAGCRRPSAPTHGTCRPLLARPSAPAASRRMPTCPGLRDALGREAEPYITRRGQKWHVDLKGVNARWLEKAGVTQIDVCPDCTACRPDLYLAPPADGPGPGGLRSP